MKEKGKYSRRGFDSVSHMRSREQKGGANNKKEIDVSNGEFEKLAVRFLQSLQVRNYSESTVENRRLYLLAFLAWLNDRSITEPASVTFQMLESYQRYLWRQRKKNGKPLSVATQRVHLITVQRFFSWLCRQNYIPANPASELELPRREKRLPQQALSRAEVKQLLNVPDVTDPLGIRDRAIIEVFYSTGIRRSELAKLELNDIHYERQTLYVRQGKGNKDRVVPLGLRALHWVDKYLLEVRPKLLTDEDEKVLFITGYGSGFNPDIISRMVSKCMKQAEIAKEGSCHLLRHSCATHMLEAGADIRLIQQLLGHESLETTSIYTQVTIEHLRDVHSKTHPSEVSGKK